MILRCVSPVLLASCFLAGSLTAQSVKRAWENEPAQWHDTADGLTAIVPAGTDYWRTTHYGFIRDNGPFRYQEARGDFEAVVRITGKYRERYHQAGLMIRIDNENWIKTGIEFVNGKQNISAVVTRKVSDWSVNPRSDSPEHLWLRLQRHGDAVQISSSLDGETWSMFRMAYFPPQVPVKIGMVAAAPGKQSFEVVFDHFSVRPLQALPKEE